MSCMWYWTACSSAGCKARNECDSREEKRDVTLSVDEAKSAGYQNLVVTDTRVGLRAAGRRAWIG